jgi:DNA methylase
VSAELVPRLSPLEQVPGPLIHPVARLFPPLESDELEALRASVRELGVLEPVLVDDAGRIVDGWHRAGLALELGLVLPTAPLPAGVSPLDVALGANLARRHLGAEQRAAILLLAERRGEAPEVKRIRAEARERKGERTDLQPPSNLGGRSGEAAEAIGELVGVSRTTVHNVERVGRELGERGLAAIVAGDSVDRVERREREEAGRRMRAELAAEARAARRRLEAAGEKPFRLELADVREWDPGPVDAIVTDPPYVTDDAPELYAALGDFAVRTLVDGGVLAVMLPPWLLLDVAAVLRRPELEYRWWIVWRFGTHANTFDFRRRVFDLTKAVLVFHRVAMPADAPTWSDLLESPGAEKDLHVWQQSEAGFGRLVERLTLPGALVCDPFCGAGTTAVAALRRERRFVGCDVDEAALELARGRLAA